MIKFFERRKLTRKIFQKEKNLMTSQSESEAEAEEMDHKKKKTLLEEEIKELYDKLTVSPLAFDRHLTPLLLVPPSCLVRPLLSQGKEVCEPLCGGSEDCSRYEQKTKEDVRVSKGSQEHLDCGEHLSCFLICLPL